MKKFNPIGTSEIPSTKIEVVEIKNKIEETKNEDVSCSENQLHRGVAKLLAITDKGTLSAFKRAVNPSYDADAYVEAIKIAPWCTDFQLSVLQKVGVLWAIHRWVENGVINGHKDKETFGKVVANTAREKDKETYAGMIDDLVKSNREELLQKLFWIIKMLKNKPIDFYDLCDMIAYWSKEFRNNSRQSKVIGDYYRNVSKE